jgi:hypothetical protein
MAKRYSSKGSHGDYHRYGCKAITFGKGRNAVEVVRCRFKPGKGGKLMPKKLVGHNKKQCRVAKGPHKGLFRACGRK